MSDWKAGVVQCGHCRRDYPSAIAWEEHAERLHALAPNGSYRRFPLRKPVLFAFTPGAPPAWPGESATTAHHV